MAGKILSSTFLHGVRKEGINEAPAPYTEKPLLFQAHHFLPPLGDGERLALLQLTDQSKVSDLISLCVTCQGHG